jgi:LEA14-like dessication related protein
MKPPEYRSISNLKVTKVSSTPEFSLNVNLYNPNSVGMKVKDYAFNISIDSLPITSVHLNEVSRAPANSEFAVPVNGTIPLAQLPKLISAGLQSFGSGTKIPVTITGNVVVKKFIFRKNFPVEFHQDIDLNFGQN